MLKCNGNVVKMCVVVEWNFFLIKINLEVECLVEVVVVLNDEEKESVVLFIVRYFE